MDPRIIRIFLSSPSDVADERHTFVALVAEINEVLAYLDPGVGVQLMVQHYETDTFPNVVGSAQEVIDQQMPADYHIHLGIMWRRAGTPTKNAPSGTIHEFDRALAYREKQADGTPVIMMYFCQEVVPFPSNEEDIKQLQNVVSFRQRVEAMGLVETYSERAAFRQRVRVGLLRAVRNILNTRQRAQPAGRKVAAFAPIPDRIPDQLEQLCTGYDALRESTPWGPERTRLMTMTVEKMKTQAPDARRALRQLMKHQSAGHRLAAIVILQLFPSSDALDWLADRLDPEAEKAFVGFNAAKALVEAVRGLPKSDCSALRAAVAKAHDLAKRNPTDPPRIRLLDYALKELAKTCGDVG